MVQAVTKACRKRTLSNLGIDRPLPSGTLSCCKVLVLWSANPITNRQMTIEFSVSEIKFICRLKQLECSAFSMEGFGRVLIKGS